MKDDQKKPLGEEEYQFPQDEYVSAENDVHMNSGSTASDQEETTARTRRPTRLSWLKNIIDSLAGFQNKRILIIGAFVVLLLIVAPLLRFFKSSPPEINTGKPVVVQQQQVSPQRIDTNTSMASLEALKGGQSETETKIQNLQAEVASLQTTLGEAKQAFDSLHETVTQLSAQVQDLTTQLNQAVAQIKAGGARGPRIVYHLRAIVPDRAWIMTNTGETVSVTIGDTLKQYGTVQSIDPKLGIVTTSSGRKIEYGSNDF